MAELQTYEEILDIRLAEIGNFAREHKMSPDAVTACFRAGEFARMVGGCDANYQKDAPHLQSVEAALNKLAKHVRKEGFTPVEIVKCFDMGHAAHTWLTNQWDEYYLEKREP